jgi:hypothetical protein
VAGRFDVPTLQSSLGGDGVDLDEPQAHGWVAQATDP